MLESEDLSALRTRLACCSMGSVGAVHRSVWGLCRGCV
eukprot:COSAG04_NODE_5750_length_1503_cov_3.631766_1_plen_37_part_10